jgi:hypothetical protein
MNYSKEGLVSQNLIYVEDCISGNHLQRLQNGYGLAVFQYKQDLDTQHCLSVDKISGAFHIHVYK